MKKIFSLCVVAFVGGLLFTACDDDSTNEVATHGLEVTSAQTSFPATGGTQTIAVAQTPTSVYTNDSWATASVSGNSINVTATANPDRQSRHATVVVKSSALDSAIVDIDQDGMIISVEETSLTSPYGDNAGALSCYIKHNLDVTLSTSASWLSAAIAGDSITINLQANNSGEPRMGWVYYTSGNITDSVSVVQFDSEKDIPGDYEMYYYDDGWYYLNTVLYKKTDGSYAMRFTDSFMTGFDFEIPVTLNYDAPGFYIHNLDSIGSYTYRNVDYVAMMLVTASSGSSVYYRSTDYYAYAEWTVDDEGYPYFPMSLTDNSSYEFYSLLIGLSTDGTFTGFRSAGRLTFLNFPYAQFQRVSDEGSEAKANKVPADGPHKLTKVPNRLSWKASQLLPVSDKTL